MSAHFRHKTPYCLVHYDHYHLIANSKVECFNRKNSSKVYFPVIGTVILIYCQLECVSKLACYLLSPRPVHIWYFSVSNLHGTYNYILLAG